MPDAAGRISSLVTVSAVPARPTSRMRSNGRSAVLATASRNKPFAGGFTTRHYGQPRDGVHAVQIEINRGLYMDEINIEKNGSFDHIAAQMTDVIAALARLTAQDLAAE